MDDFVLALGTTLTVVLLIIVIVFGIYTIREHNRDAIIFADCVEEAIYDKYKCHQMIHGGNNGN